MLQEITNFQDRNPSSQNLQASASLCSTAPEVLACEILTRTNFSPHQAVLAERLQLSLLLGTTDAKDIILALDDESQQIQLAGYLEPEDVVGLAFLLVEDQQNGKDEILLNRITTICSHTSKFFTDTPSSEAMLAYLQDMVNHVSQGISKTDISSQIRAYASTEDSFKRAQIVSHYGRPYLTAQMNRVASFEEAQRWIKRSSESLQFPVTSSREDEKLEVTTHTYETFRRRLGHLSSGFIFPEAETRFLVDRWEIKIASDYFDLYKVSKKDGRLGSDYFVPLRATDTLIAFDLKGSKAAQQNRQIADVTHIINWAGMMPVLIELGLLQNSDIHDLSARGLDIECGDSVAHVAGDGGWIIASTPQAVARWTEILKTAQIVLQVHPEFAQSPLWMRGYKVTVSEIGQQVYIGAFEGPLRDSNGTRQVQYALGGPALARLEDYIKRLACPAPWDLAKVDLSGGGWDPYIIDYRVVNEVNQNGELHLRLAEEADLQSTIDRVLGRGQRASALQIQQFNIELDMSAIPLLIEEEKKVGFYEPGSYIVVSPNMAGQSVQSAPQNRFVADITNWRSLIEIFRTAHVKVIGQVDEPGVSRLMVLYPSNMSQREKDHLYNLIYKEARNKGIYLFLGGISSGTSDSVTLFKSSAGHLIQMVAPGPEWLFSAAAGVQSMEHKYQDYVREKLTTLRRLSDNFQTLLPDPDDNDRMVEMFPDDNEVERYRKAFALLRSIYLDDQAFRKTLVSMSAEFQSRAKLGHAYWLEQLGIDPNFLGLEETGRTGDSYLISARDIFCLPERYRPPHDARTGLSHLRH